MNQRTVYRNKHTGRCFICKCGPGEDHHEECPGAAEEVEANLRAAFSVNPEDFSAEPETAAQILRRMAKINEQRAELYGTNYLTIGHVMHALFGDRPPRLATPGDWNRLHLFMLKCVKLTRYANLWHRTDQKGRESRADTIEDDGVYTAMLAHVDQLLEAAEEEGHD